MNLSDTERAALASLTGALGTVLVMDVTATPVAPEAISGPSSVRTGTCRCCGKRRDLVAHTSMAATAGRLMPSRSVNENRPDEPWNCFFQFS